MIVDVVGVLVGTGRLSILGGKADRGKNSSRTQGKAESNTGREKAQERRGLITFHRFDFLSC